MKWRRENKKEKRSGLASFDIRIKNLVRETYESYINNEGLNHYTSRLKDRL